MKKYLVIGNPIDHSLSPIIHNYWIKKYNLKESIYEKRKTEEKELEKIISEIRENKIRGINVTVPFKQKIIPYLDDLEPTAKKTESVNTVFKVGDKIIGYNTDEPGFGMTLDNFFSKKNEEFKNIFIIGAGGVTSSIIYALQKLNTNIFLSNRTIKKSIELKDKYPKIKILNWGDRPASFDIVINTTSIGLKNNEKINLDFRDCEKDKKKIFYDLIYNPKKTNFLKDAEKRGNTIMNGQKMFFNQAMLAFNIWTNIKPEIDSKLIQLMDK